MTFEQELLSIASRLRELAKDAEDFNNRLHAEATKLKDILRAPEEPIVNTREEPNP